MKLSVVVIGAASSLRSKSLLECLPTQTKFVPPVVKSQSDVFSDMVFQFLVHGRVLNSGEIGCAEAHMNARKLAFSQGADWNLILEDDATFTSQHFSILHKALENLNPKNAEIVVFPTDPSGVLKFDGLEPISWLPTGAVAACYSSASLGLMHGSYWKNEVADWPSMFSDSNFSLVRGAHVGGLENSTIGARPVSRGLYATSLVLRIGLAPFLAKFSGMSLGSFFDWYVVRIIRSSLRARNCVGAKVKYLN